MKIRQMIASVGLAVALGGLATPASAQTTERTVHREVVTAHDTPMRHETVVNRTVVNNAGVGVGGNVVRREVVSHNVRHENRSWHSNRWHKRHCRTVWRHHHRVRRCW
jgi:hypothetical protein